MPNEAEKLPLLHLLYLFLSHYIDDHNSSRCQAFWAFRVWIHCKL